MRRYLLLLALALPAAGILATGPPCERLAAQAPDDPKQPQDQPAPPEKLGKLTLTLDPGWHTRPINKVFFLPDGQQVITLSSDHGIRIWDPLTGQMHKVLYPPGVGGLGAAALSSDGKRLALASRYPGAGPVIYVLTLPEGRIERVLRGGHKGSIGVLAFSPNGKRLASGSSTTWASQAGDNTIRLWNLDKEEAGQVPYTFGNFGPTGLCFSPDGRRLVAVGRLQGQIFDLGAGKKAAPLKFAASLKGYDGIVHVNEVDWSPDGKTLATISSKGVNLWDANGKPRMLLPTRGVPSSVAFSPDSGTVLATWNAEPKEFNKATLFEVLTGKRLFEFPSDKIAEKPRGLHALSGAVSPNGQLAVTGGGSTCAWNTQDGAIHKEWVVKYWLPTLSPDTAGAAWSADGKAVAWKNKATSAKTPAFHLGDLHFGPPLAKKDAHGPVVKQGGWSLDRSMSNKVRVLYDGKRSALLEFKGNVLGATLVSKDRVAIAAENSPLGLYDAHTGKLIRHFKGQPSIYTDGIAASPDGRFLLTISWDQKLRIWNPEQEKPLLTLYMSGKDWIIWTPEGYYAATPGGERLMGWTLDNGIDQMPTYYPAERFRKVLYRPDVIKLLLEKGNVEEALATANAVLKKEGKIVAEGVADPNKLLPPKASLQILDKKDLPKIKVKASAVAAVANQPVTALRLLIDGRPLPEGAGLKTFGPDVKKPEAEWTIDLPPGKHHLAVLARSPDASSVSESIEIDVGAAAKQAVLHVLTVGINQYDDKSLNLEFAAKDASALAHAFQKQGQKPLFAPVVPKILIDKQAQRQAILDHIQAVRKQAQDNDLFVVFFAGHGVKEKDEFYLLSVEAQTNQLAKTALSGEDLRKALGAFPCQVLLMLDACHSAGFGEGGKLRKHNLRPATDDATRALTDDEIGVAVMCAAMGHEKALEKSGNGLFTRAVLEALQGGQGVPRHPRTGRLYLHHLQAFVFDRVSDESDDRQHPFLSLPWVVESFPVAQFAAK